MMVGGREVREVSRYTNSNILAYACISARRFLSPPYARGASVNCPAVRGVDDEHQQLPRIQKVLEGDKLPANVALLTDCVDDLWGMLRRGTAHCVRLDIIGGLDGWIHHISLDLATCTMHAEQHNKHMTRCTQNKKGCGPRPCSGRRAQH